MKKLNQMLHKSGAKLLMAVILGGFSVVAANAATYTVTNTADAGDGSLRSAVQAANAAVTDDMVAFDIPSTDAGCANGVCTIILRTGEITVLSDNSSGAIAIVNQNGANSLEISGNNSSRIFNIQPKEKDALVDGLTIRNGNGVGQFSNGSGGGVTILATSATTGTVTITNSVFNFNFAASTGGALNAGNNTRVIISNSIFRNNSVYGTNGGGGAIINAATTMTIINSVISGNSADDGSGGGIANGAPLTVANTTISDNSATNGGGISSAAFVDSFNIINSTLSNNAAVSGGGIYAVSNGAIYNSTISGNWANGSGGGVYCGILGPVAGKISLTNATVSSNGSANYGGGIANADGASTTILNTIVADNTAGISQPDILHGANDTFTSNSYNLVGNTNTGTAVAWKLKDVLNKSPRLAPLANNGGATKTQALLVNSPAIDKGNPCVLSVGGCAANSPALTSDQRGSTRSFNDFVDIGAYEYNMMTTAAGVKVGGRVTTADGRGLTGALVTLMDARGQSKTMMTSSFGQFQFKDVAAGQTVVLTITSKKYSFAPQVLSLTSDLNELVLTSQK